MKTLIVIPTYNEKQNIELLVDELLQLGDYIRILIIDDNSPDGTGEIADTLASKYKQIEVIHRAGKLGLGSAYVAGFKYALKQDVDYILEMDADFSHDPKIVQYFIEAMEKYDVVIGSRYLTGISVVNWPLRRLILSLMASMYVRIVLNLSIRDCTAGFKCFKKEVLQNINLDAIHSDGYAFQIEMNYRCFKKGYKIGEIPIIFMDRHIGSSKMSKKIVYEAIWVVWRLRFEYLFK
ncbi:MAG: polyprenol monophosphomannose synthase [Candidatus Firestonebacteria bacterium]